MLPVPLCIELQYQLHVYVEWDLFIKDTIGNQLANLYRELSLIQRQICTLLYVIEAADTVLIREVSFIRVSFRERGSTVYILGHRKVNSVIS